MHSYGEQWSTPDGPSSSPVPLERHRQSGFVPVTGGRRRPPPPPLRHRVRSESGSGARWDGLDGLEEIDVEITFDNADEEDNAPTERFERRSELPPPPVSEVGRALAEARAEAGASPSSAPPSMAGSRLTPHMLPAITVAICVGRTGRGVELVPIAEDEEPPDGAPTAVIVPDSSRDGALIVRMLERCL